MSQHRIIDMLKDIGVLVYSASYGLFYDELITVILFSLGITDYVNEFVKLILLLAGGVLGIWLMWQRAITARSEAKQKALDVERSRLEIIARMIEVYPAQEIAEMMAIEEIDELKKRITQKLDEIDNDQRRRKYIINNVKDI